MLDAGAEAQEICGGSAWSNDRIEKDRRLFVKLQAEARPTTTKKLFFLLGSVRGKLEKKKRLSPGGFRDSIRSIQSAPRSLSPALPSCVLPPSEKTGKRPSRDAPGKEENQLCHQFFFWLSDVSTARPFFFRSTAHARALSLSPPAVREMSLGAKAASSVLRAAWRPATAAATRLAETVDKEIVADVFSCAMKKQTGVSLKYMLTFGHVPLERQVSVVEWRSAVAEE